MGKFLRKDGRMSKYTKVQTSILSGRSDANITFSDLVGLLGSLGFIARIRGSHHIFTKSGVGEIINLQPRGHLAKPYQVKQVRALLVKYRMGVDDSE